MPLPRLRAYYRHNDQAALMGGAVSAVMPTTPTGYVRLEEPVVPLESPENTAEYPGCFWNAWAAPPPKASAASALGGTAVGAV
jgi:hypothetical protein